MIFASLDIFGREYKVTLLAQMDYIEGWGLPARMRHSVIHRWFGVTNIPGRTADWMKCSCMAFFQVPIWHIHFV